MKPCIKCGAVERSRRNGKCKPCVRAYTKQYRADNPEKVRSRKRKWVAENQEKVKAYNKQYQCENRDKIKARSKKYYENNYARYLARKYGIAPEEHALLFAKQEGCCAICGSARCSSGNRFAVDHDHQTGEVRGLLCKRCNMVIGIFEDSAELLQAAGEYLLPKRFSTPFAAELLEGLR